MARMARLKMDPAKCKVRCRMAIDPPSGKPVYEAYIYEGSVEGCVARYWVSGATREGALKKLALQVFDDLIFEEEQNDDLRKGG